MTAIQLRGIGKRFGHVRANRDVDVEIASGRVHAVVGENGAGKSTLMKIAYGQLRADAGTIAIKGENIPLAAHTPGQSIRRGVGMVFQHFMLVGPLTVVENAILGREPTVHGVLDLKTPHRELAELAKQHGLAVDPGARIDDLTVGQKQRVEILKVLWQGCDVLILDEPTAVLTPQEVQQLFDVLRALVDEGGTVVMITHKLDEVAEIADDITVMRRGEAVARLSGHTATPTQIAEAMVGRPVLLEVEKQPAQPGSTVLSVEDVSVTARNGRVAVDGLSLEIGAGEILGIAGVVGNGQSELADAIIGLANVEGGRIRVGKNDITNAPVAARYAAGLAHVPEDRQERGLILSMTVAENLVLGRHGDFCRGFALDLGKIDSEAARQIEESDIRPPDRDLPVSALSGGNQQKIVIARELAREPRLLVCSQPTRGVDIGAIEHIHKRIIAARDSGAAVLLISAELSELSSLADRIAVMYRGQIVAVLGRDELEADDAMARIGAMMTGASE